MAVLDDLLGELGEEMRSIANYWQIDLGIVVSLNFAYELRKVCQPVQMLKYTYILHP